MPRLAGRAAQKPKPTREDAALMLQVAQLGAVRGLHEASNWLWSDKFLPDYAEFRKKFPRGSAGAGHARVISTHYETLGTLWKNKLINEDLLFDWLWITGVWDRMKGIVLGERKEAGERRLGENFQKMAAAQVRWSKQPGR